MRSNTDARLAMFRKNKELQSSGSLIGPDSLHHDVEINEGANEYSNADEKLSSAFVEEGGSGPSTADCSELLCARCHASVKDADDVATTLCKEFSHPPSLVVIYLTQRESSDRLAITSSEQNDFLSNIVWPFLKGCERLLRLAVLESSVLRQKLVTSRLSAQTQLEGKDRAMSPNESSVVSVLRQQLSDQQARHAQEIERVQQRRVREQALLREGFERQIACLEGQVNLLKQRMESDAARAYRIDSGIVEMRRSLPREVSLSASPTHVDTAVSRNRSLQLRKGQLSEPFSPSGRELGDPIEVSREVSCGGPSHRSCPSLNPRHSTVVASIDGSSWRSIYLVVTAEGACCFSESISDAVSHLLFLDEVTSLKLGSSKHAQRPLLLSVSYRGGSRQLDIALADKSERESWRQAFRHRGKGAQQTNHEIDDTLSPTLNSRGESAPRCTADSLASTPSISSANPMPSDHDNPSLKRWLESQADNLRGGHLDPEGAYVTAQDMEDLSKVSVSEVTKRSQLATSSPVASRPPLGSSVSKDVGATTTSTSSRDRLPPLAPLHKRRSTISGSASTADSLTEDEAAAEQAPPVALFSAHFDEPIAPVSPSHTSDGLASPPSSEDDSIHLSPELSPLELHGPR